MAKCCKLWHSVINLFGWFFSLMTKYCRTKVYSAFCLNLIIFFLHRIHFFVDQFPLCLQNLIVILQSCDFYLQRKIIFYRKDTIPLLKIYQVIVHCWLCVSFVWSIIVCDLRLILVYFYIVCFKWHMNSSWLRARRKCA